MPVWKRESSAAAGHRPAGHRPLDWKHVLAHFCQTCLAACRKRITCIGWVSRAHFAMSGMAFNQGFQAVVSQRDLPPYEVG